MGIPASLPLSDTCADLVTPCQRANTQCIDGELNYQCDCKAGYRLNTQTQVCQGMIISRMLAYEVAHSTLVPVTLICAI